LVQNGPQTADELARAAGIAPRYAHEGLQQQAVAGLLEVDDPRAPAEVRRGQVLQRVLDRRVHLRCVPVADLTAVQRDALADRKGAAVSREI
jgi:hypothetical protein